MVLKRATTGEYSLPRVLTKPDATLIPELYYMRFRCRWRTYFRLPAPLRRDPCWSPANWRSGVKNGPPASSLSKALFDPLPVVREPVAGESGPQQDPILTVEIAWQASFSKRQLTEHSGCLFA